MYYVGRVYTLWASFVKKSIRKKCVYAFFKEHRPRLGLRDDPVEHFDRWNVYGKSEFFLSASVFFGEKCQGYVYQSVLDVLFKIMGEKIYSRAQSRR